MSACARERVIIYACGSMSMLCRQEQGGSQADEPQSGHTSLSDVNNIAADCLCCSEELTYSVTKSQYGGLEGRAKGAELAAAEAKARAAVAFARASSSAPACAYACAS